MPKLNRVYISIFNLMHVVTSLEESLSQLNDVDKLAFTRLKGYLYLISQELQRTLAELEKE